MTSQGEVLFHEGDTKVELRSDSAEGLVLTLTGEIAQPNPGEFLDPLLQKVHQDALANKVPQVSVDLTGLSFLNSSGIKSLGAWVVNHQAQDAANRYRLEFIYNRAVTWQHASLKALTVLSRGSISLNPV